MRYGDDWKPRGLKMRILTLAAVVALGACQTAATEPAQRSARAQQTYESLLAGKVAGQPVRCLPNFRTNDMVPIDENTILFRDGRTVYVNTPIGSCYGLGRFNNALVTRTFNSNLCRGDIAQVVDPTTGVHAGSCALGDFVPYRPS
jgi:hypothetical protein